MAVSITATVLSGPAPAPVQVVLNGMIAGDEYVVRGNQESFSWPVPGGVGVSDGTQVVLIDNRAPFNGAITYTVFIDGVPTVTPSFVLSVNAYTILQTLDGRRRAVVEVADPLDKRSYDHSVALFKPSRRADPVPRIDVPSTPSMQWPVEAEADDADMLKAMLADEFGQVLVRRNTVGLRDVPPVEIVVVTNHSDELVGAVGLLRMFGLDVQAIGDPEPGTALAAFDWDDFDSEWASLSWNNFDSEWSGLGWDDFDLRDYGS